MNKINSTANFVLAWILILPLILGACSPVEVAQKAPEIAQNAVETMSVGSTLWGLTRVLAERSGTISMIDASKTNVMLGWSVNGTQSWAFWLFDTNAKMPIAAGNVITNGQALAVNTFSGFVEHLKANGWTVISSAAIPGVVKEVVLSATLHMAQSWTTVVVMFPAGVAIDDVTREKLRLVPEGEWQ